MGRDIRVVLCDAGGTVTQCGLDSVEKGLNHLYEGRGKRCNWGKCFEIRGSDGKYIFHAEFQQRFDL